MPSAVTVPGLRSPSANAAEEPEYPCAPTVYRAFMGRLRYDGTSEPILIEDETLAHLKIVIATKLRRQESFMMTWRPSSGTDKRATVWIHPAIPLQFGFDNAEPPSVDARLVAEMMKALNATGELVLDHLIAPS